MAYSLQIRQPLKHYSFLLSYICHSLRTYNYLLHDDERAAETRGGGAGGAGGGAAGDGLLQVRRDDRGEGDEGERGEVDGVDDGDEAAGGGPVLAREVLHLLRLRHQAEGHQGEHLQVRSP